MKIRFAGFGGQGIVMCGVVFGQAGMLDGRSAMQTQSYGSASRGGLTRSDVCIQDGEIHDFVYDDFDVLVAMSQQSWDAFRGLLRPGGTLFYERDMVDLGEDPPERAFGIPATDLAYKAFGRKIMANMVMMGFVNGHLALVTREALLATVREHVPPGTEDRNVSAFEEGERLAAEGAPA